jgi:type I restriction enzyme S subunit
MRDWQEFRMGELAEITSSNRIFSSDLVSTGVPFYRSKEIIEKFKGDDVSTKLFISQQQFEKIKSKFGVPQKGDILLTSRGTIGTPYLVRDNEEFYFADGNLTWFKNFNHVCDSTFVFYLLQSDKGRGAINSILIGSSQAALTIDDIKRIKIKLPPLLIQLRIAEILGRYDALIENCKLQISILEASARMLYREWFVRGRCPNAHPQIDALPIGWRVGTLREVIEYYIGGGWGNDEANAEFSVGGFVVRGTDIPRLKRGQINSDVYRFHKPSNIKTRELNTGDIVFEVAGGSKEQPLGRNALIMSELLRQYGGKVICASFCKQIRAKKKVMSPFYLQQLFDHLIETEEMGQFEVQSTGISNFQFEDFIDFQPVLLPSKDDLDKFDKIVEPIYRKIGLLGLQTSKLRQMRDKLLPHLMSGQIPLTVTE